jgi:cob(I)alamin adenosyltransferase
MSTGEIEVIYGNGFGKTALALGRGLQLLANHKNVIVIQFLKGSQKEGELDIIKRLEPEMKVFRFERSSCYFEELSEEKKHEEQINIRNGLNYARKVLATGECGMLILDEVLGLIDQKIIPLEDLLQILEKREEASVVLTGKVLPDGLARYADRIDRIDRVQG